MFGLQLLETVCGGVGGGTGDTAGTGTIPELRVDGRWDSPLLRLHEDQLTARAAFDTVFIPMQLPVVVAAQRDQVLKARLAPVGPVADVVGVGPAMLIAAGEAAPAVAYPQAYARCATARCANAARC